jgi:hypothetical protein
MAGHGFLHVDVGIDDLEESKGIFVDVEAAELSNFIGCISNKADEVTTEVGMNLGSIDVGKVVEALGNSSQGGNGAGTNTSKVMIKVFCEKVIGWVWRASESALLGVEFGVVVSRSTHAVDKVGMKEIRLCQTFFTQMLNSNGEWQIVCS